MSETKRVPGHTLLFEGAPHDAFGRRIGIGDGRGKCSCGALSEMLPSGYKRKQWHRDHKAEVVA